MVSAVSSDVRKRNPGKFPLEEGQVFKGPVCKTWLNVLPVNTLMEVYIHSVKEVTQAAVQCISE